MRSPLFPLFALLVACISTLGDDTPLGGDVSAQCIVPTPELHAALPVPVPFARDGALLLPDPDGTHAVQVALAPLASDPCAPLRVTRDEADAIVDVLPLAPAEVAANAARVDGARLTLVPLTAAKLGERALVFYEQVLVGPAGETSLGAGMCILAGAQPCTRIARGGSTTLFAPNRRPVSALADGDAIMVLACANPAAFEQTCVLGRVVMGANDTPDVAWATFDGWGSSDAAIAVLHDVGTPSLRHDAADGGPTVVVFDPLTGELSLRMASAWGSGFGDRRLLVTLATTKDARGGALDPSSSIVVRWMDGAGQHRAAVALRGAIR